MPATAREQKLVRAREVDRGLDVGWPGAAHDQGRTPVDVAVPDLTRGLVLAFPLRISLPRRLPRNLSMAASVRLVAVPFNVTAVTVIAFPLIDPAILPDRERTVVSILCVMVYVDGPPCGIAGVCDRNWSPRL
jgi:hypothetical protein